MWSGQRLSLPFPCFPLLQLCMWRCMSQPGNPLSRFVMDGFLVLFLVLCRHTQKATRLWQKCPRTEGKKLGQSLHVTAWVMDPLPNDGLGVSKRDGRDTPTDPGGIDEQSSDEKPETFGQEALSVGKYVQAHAEHSIRVG